MKKILFSLAAFLCLTACVEDGMYPYAAVSNLANTIAYDETEAVTVTATATAFVDITEVNIIYKAGSAAEKSVKMTGSGSTYTGVIPAQPMNTEVKYRVEATTEAGTVASNTVSYTVGVIPIDFSPLKLNELNGNDKFIEIINTGKDAINLKGLHVLKDTKDVWTGPDRELAGGAVLLLYSEDVVIAGGAKEGYDEALVFTSGLSAKKAVRVELVDPKGGSLDDFNLVTCVKPAAASYSRVPDGTGKWCHTAATPDAKNATDNSDPVEGLQ